MTTQVTHMRPPRSFFFASVETSAGTLAGGAAMLIQLAHRAPLRNRFRSGILCATTVWCSANLLEVPLTHTPAREEFESQLLPILDFLLGVAMQLSGGRDQAEDLVQESVLKAYRSFATFRPGSNFRAWMARILRNTYLTDRSRAKRWGDGIDPDTLPDGSGDPHISAEAEQFITKLEDIPRNAFSDEVLSALHELPGDMATAVYLADVDELPYAEIAEILQIPVGTVRSRVSRGRQHLQQRLLEVARDLGWAGKESR